MQARSLFTSELADPNLSAIISTKMARVHALNVPISKEPSWIWNTMDKWLKSSQDFLNNRSLSDREDAQKIAKLQLFNFQKEMEFLRKVVGKVQSPVVFAHNDMQEGNILLNTHAKTRDDQVCLIDFEYCSYNYRGFDVANHFCEWVYEYKLPVDPYFTVARENYPGKDKQLFFIRSYLEAYEAARRRKVVQPTNAIEDSHPISSVSVLSQNNRMMSNMAAPPHPAEDKLLAEVQVFTLVSHLFWTLWSIVQSQVSTIPFGYTDYAIVRMEHYLEDKANLNVDIINKRKSEAMCEDE